MSTNMLGAFDLGSTMLGADADSKSGAGGSGSGVGNMLGGFHLGSTMLGADPGGGGGGDAPPITVGAIYPVSAAIAGIAQTVGAFATFTYPVSATSVGMAVVANTYLNAPWALAASTLRPTGVTQYSPGWSFTSIPAPGQRLTSITYSIAYQDSGNNGTAVYHKLSDGTYHSQGGYSSGANNSFTWTFNAPAGTYIHEIRIGYTSNPLRLLWEAFGEPQATVSATIFSPIGLRADGTGTATVTGDLSTHTLDGGDCIAGATVEGDANRQLSVTSGLILSSANVVADLQNVKDLYANPSGEASVQSELVLTDVIFGTSDVTGELSTHNLRGRAIGIATVTGNPRRLDVYQGDAKGSDDVDAHLSLRHPFLPEESAGSATVRAFVINPVEFGTAAASGEASVTGNVDTFILRGGRADGQASLFASLKYLNDTQQFSAFVNGETTTAGDFRLRMRFAGSTSNGFATVSCDKLIRVWFVDGRADGNATVTFDALTIHYPAPGPIVCDSEVEAHLSHDARYGGTILCVSTAKGLLSADYLLPTASPQGTSTAKGVLYVRPQDFEPDRANGSAAVLGAIVLTKAQLTGISRGGRFEINPANPFTGEIPFRDERGVPIVTGYNDLLVKGHMGVAFFFTGISRATSFAEVEAILLINDSGLIRGNSRLDARLDRLSTEYQGRSNGFATVPYAFVDRPQDLRAQVNDAYAGVGKWYPGDRKDVPIYADYGGFRPFDDDLQVPAHGEPGHVHLDGSSYTVERMNARYTVFASERRFVGKWDGTYEPVGPSDVPNLPQHPWFTDPERGFPSLVPGKLPGPMRRRLQLADPGQLGGWFVDNRGPGFRDKGMLADIIGEARFDEPQSTVDMDLELKSSMKGKIVCDSTVLAFALLLSYRKILVSGNVTALRYLLREATGNTAKSDQTRVPITQADSELIRPARASTALYV